MQQAKRLMRLSPKTIGACFLLPIWSALAHEHPLLTEFSGILKTYLIDTSD